MRIVLLAHSLRSAGGLVVAHNFISALVGTRPEHQYMVTVPAGCGYENVKLPTGSRFYMFSETSILSRLKMEFKTIPQFVSDFKADVVMGMGNHGLRNISCTQVIWVQNAYLVYPAKHFPKASLKTLIHVYLQRLYLKNRLAHTDLVFCQTPVMQKRLSCYYHYPESRIKILPNAISSFLKEPDSEEEPPAGIERGKFNCLVLSKYYIHKNPEILIDECLRSPDSFDGICFITTVSENDSKRAKKFAKRIQENTFLRRLFHNVGPIRHEYIGSYYCNCQLVIMPTLMESFSVTYLEAMRFGVPILTTDLDFARYLCGNAAIFFNPYIRGSFTEKLLEIKRNNVLRNKLISAGYEQLEKFSHTWHNMVNTAIDALEQVVAGNTTKLILRKE